MRKTIPTTPSSAKALEKAEAKRRRRIERNIRIFGAGAPETIDYESMKVADLLALAKERGLKATTKTRKDTLVEMLSV